MGFPTVQHSEVRRKHGAPKPPRWILPLVPEASGLRIFQPEGVMSKAGNPGSPVGFADKSEPASLVTRLLQQQDICRRTRRGARICYTAKSLQHLDHLYPSLLVSLLSSSLSSAAATHSSKATAKTRRSCACPGEALLQWGGVSPQLKEQFS